MLAKLDIIENTGATPVRTPVRWAQLSLLPEIKAELGGQRNTEVGLAYDEFKQNLPQDGVYCTSTGSDDVFEREPREKEERR